MKHPSLPIAVLSLIVCVLGLVARAADATPAKPNIILIMADDLGYAALSSYGQRFILTPEIDKMAAAGMRFTDFYAGNTVCVPSRVSTLMGMHPGHAPIRDNLSIPPAELEACNVNRSKRIVWEPPMAAASPPASGPANNSLPFDIFLGRHFARHHSWHNAPRDPEALSQGFSSLQPSGHLAFDLPSSLSHRAESRGVSTGSQFDRLKDDSCICQTLGVPRQSRGVTSVTYLIFRILQVIWRSIPAICGPRNFRPLARS